VAAVEGAYIVVPGRSLGDGHRCADRVGGKPQRAGKIVGGAGGDVADRGIAAGLQNAGDGFIKGAVAAAAHHQIHFSCPGLDEITAVAGVVGHIGQHIVACPVEHRKDLGQHLAGFAGPGGGI